MNSGFRLITDDRMLRHYFPSVWKEAPGEPPFLRRLAPWLNRAQEFVDTNILTLDESLEAEGNKDFLDAARALCVSLALRMAAPSLDLALTANGFVTAGTQTAVPVSAQRMDRLLWSLSLASYEALRWLLTHLHSLKGWLQSRQACFLAESFVQSPTAIDEISYDAVPLNKESAFPHWERFLLIRAKAIEVESHLADFYFSHQLLTELRQRTLARSLRHTDLRLVEGITSQVMRSVAGAPVNDGAMRNLVDYIRKNTDAFPQWELSEVAALFRPAAFQNRKDAPGYFF